MKATKVVGYIDTHVCCLFSFVGKYHFIPSSFFKLLGFACKVEIMELCSFHLVPRFEKCSLCNKANKNMVHSIEKLSLVLS
jgi:hypothetical protein